MIDEYKLVEDIEDNFCNDCIKCAGSCRYAEIVEIIYKQPKVGEWIPVEERLPEDGEYVLVWFEYFRYGSYNRLFQTHGLSYAYDGKWSGFVNGQSGWHQLSIIAWMPLPTPYDMRKKVEE